MLAHVVLGPPADLEADDIRLPLRREDGRQRRLEMPKAAPTPGDAPRFHGSGILRLLEHPWSGSRFGGKGYGPEVERPANLLTSEAAIHVAPQLNRAFSP